MSDTDEDKATRLCGIANAISEALSSLIDGRMVLAIDGMVIVRHPDDKVGATAFNIGIDEETKGWAATQSLKHHLGALGTPDKSETNVIVRSKKH